MAEQRLIDANEAIEIAKEYYWTFGISIADLTDLRKVLKDCTTVDAKPVVHAHWIYDKDTSLWGNPYICSKCHMANDSESEFCPHCGAQMDEKEG